MYLKRTEPGSVYEDASTVDPSALNEALTGTRPSDLEGVDVFAPYDEPAPQLSTEVTGVAEHSAPDPGYQTNPPQGWPNAATGGIDPAAVPPGTQAVTTTGIPPEGGNGRHSAPEGEGTGEPNPTPTEPPAPPEPGQTPEGHPSVPGVTPSNETQES